MIFASHKNFQKFVETLDKTGCEWLFLGSIL